MIQRQVIPSKDKLTPELASCGWDDPLPEKYLDSWKNWKNSLSELESLKLPRCFVPNEFSSPKRELHVFSDASEVAIGFCIYMRCIERNNVHVTFVAGSSKVAPRCATSIPRLELCAAVEATQCAHRILSDLESKPDCINYYTDSMIVLGYINNYDKRFSNYVTRRVALIHKTSTPKEWHFVRTHDNPADIASRSCKPCDLSRSMWLRGPEFLWSQTCPGNYSAVGFPADLPEQVNKTLTLQTTVSEFSIVHGIITRLNSWLKIVRTVQIILKILHVLDLVRQNTGISLAARAREVKHNGAVLFIIKCVQAEAYCNAIKCLNNSRKLAESDPLCDLSPFVDRAGVLRVGGRLNNSSLPFDNAHPVLIPSDHPIAPILVRFFHEKIGHQGRHLTHGEIRRSGFHIHKGKSFLKKFLSDCVLCRKLRGKPVTQLMADLPKDRLEEIPLFTNTATDVFGPYFVHDRKVTRSSPGKRKLWVIIFVCLVSRAVHLDILVSLDTNAFKNALQRFISLRGTPKLFRSDNGTNFVSTVSQMSDINVNSVQRYLSGQNIEWLFNPPYASHFGGAYERKIGSVKRVMEGCLALMGPRSISADEFSTLLQEAGAIVNNTPLCEVSADPSDPMPITPAALLTQRESPNPPPLETFNPSDMTSFGAKRWRRTQYLATEFWIRWRRDYILEQQRRHKWKLRQPCIGVGDVVLVKNKAAKRNEWSMGRVFYVKPSKDGLIRTVTLTLPPLSGSNVTRTQIRCIHDLVLLVPSVSHGKDCFSSAR